ncbi:hypothetical protein AAAV73_11975 [Hominicoprocola fusiformis]
MKMPFLLISPKIVPKIQLIKKGGCFEYHAVIADKIKYRYVHRASICPALGMDRRSFFMPKPMGKYKRLEVFYLSKPVYTADKPSDCHYCYFWTNGRKGCRLGRNNCYYLISLPPKPKSECDGCPYGRDHPCIGWCTKKVIKLLSELEKKAGLIERKRQGLGKPNLIYVKNFISAVDSQLLNCENHNSGTMEITTQELPKSQCNNTDIKNTEFSDTDSIFPSGNGGMMDENDRYQEYFDYFSDQLSMDLLKKD